MNFDIRLFIVTSVHEVSFYGRFFRYFHVIIFMCYWLVLSLIYLHGKYILNQYWISDGTKDHKVKDVELKLYLEHIAKHADVFMH